jgi:hypothetical protein
MRGRGRGRGRGRLLCAVESRVLGFGRAGCLAFRGREPFLCWDGTRRDEEGRRVPLELTVGSASFLS